MSRYIDADEVLDRLREYRKLSEENVRDVRIESYHDMDIADLSMGAFYGKMRDLLKDLVELSKYEERIEVIDLMCVFIEGLAEKSMKGDDGAGSS
jgi:hypothetical protein